MKKDCINTPDKSGSFNQGKPFNLLDIHGADYEAKMNAACEVLRTANLNTLRAVVIALASELVSHAIARNLPDETHDLAALCLAAQFVQSKKLSAAALLAVVDISKMAVN